jgi:hypothetical protein
MLSLSRTIAFAGEVEAQLSTPPHGTQAPIRMLGKVAVNHLKIRSMAAPWRRFPYLRMRMKMKMDQSCRLSILQPLATVILPE